MEKIAIAVGTKSAQKLGYLKEVVNQIGLDIEIKPIGADSKVSSQPITEAETKEGSINRAHEALKKIPSAECGLGIEVGYHRNKHNKFEMFCYASIIDKKNSIISEKSHSFVLPNFYQEKLNTNLQMSEHVEEYYKKDNHPATQFMAEMIDKRKPFIIEAIRSVLLRYFKREEY